MNSPDRVGTDLICIKVLDGPEKGKKYFLTKHEITIGPGNDKDIYTPFKDSEDHASIGYIRIYKKGEEFWIEEPENYGVTSVDGCKIDGNVRLMIGTIFRLGQISFQVIGPSLERDILMGEQLKKTIIT